MGCWCRVGGVVVVVCVVESRVNGGQGWCVCVCKKEVYISPLNSPPRWYGVVLSFFFMLELNRAQTGLAIDDNILGKCITRDFERFTGLEIIDLNGDNG